MIKYYKLHISGSMVKFLTPAAMVYVQIQHEARFMACLYCCLGTVFVKHCFGGLGSTVPVRNYGSNNNRLKIRERERERERVEWMVCDFDRVSS